MNQVSKAVAALHHDGVNRCTEHGSIAIKLDRGAELTKPHIFLLSKKLRKRFFSLPCFNIKMYYSIATTRRNYEP